jgi:hypothetical protein
MANSAIERTRRRSLGTGGRLALLLPIAVTVGLFASGGARAQTQPTSLLPKPVVSTQLSPSAGLSPAASSAGATEPVTGTAPSEGPVQVQQLQNLDINAFGTLDEAHGGLPAGLWSGTDPAVADKLLATVRPTASRPLAGLVRRLLLSVATPPAAADGAAAAAAQGPSLIERRAQALWTLGRADDLASLLKSLPLPAITPSLRRMRADAALLVGDSSTACAEAQPLAAASATDPFPVELRVYCQFVAGQAAAAGLGIDVLREQGANDPVFFTLADALSGAVPLPKSGVAPATPLTMALARLAKADLPEPGPDTPPMVLRSIALVAGAPLDIRLAAGERAEAIGALDTETLRRLYASVPFTADELSNAETKSASMAPPRAHAILYQAADRQTVALAKSGLIARALNGADGPVYFVVARAFASEIAGLQPSPDIALYAPAMTRALLAAHQFDAARGWIGWVRAQAAADKAVAATAADLTVKARLAQLVDAPLTADELNAWRDAATGLPADRVARRGGLGLALLAALGDPVPPQAWLAQIDTAAPLAAQVPSPALALGLDTAAAGKRTGEIILYACAMLGDGTMAQTDVASIARVVATLKGAGFDAEAHALALDAALANGV